MTWSSTDIIPTTVNISNNFSTTAGAFLNDTILSIAPVNSSGTKFDFTAATACTLAAANIGQGPDVFQSAETTVSPTLVSHDATGLKVRISAANWLTLMTAVGGTSAKLNLTATDGTTALLAGTGNITAVVTP